jgi:hypothetical protein
MNRKTPVEECRILNGAALSLNNFLVTLRQDKEIITQPKGKKNT